MLTAVVESCGIKCNAYWPDVVGDSRKYNQLTIQLFDIAEVELSTKILMFFIKLLYNNKIHIGYRLRIML
jgi:hypothetical protein